MVKKNVLYIFCSKNFSGAEIVLERLIENNCSVNAIALCSPGEFSEKLITNKIETYIDASFSSLDRGKKKYNPFSFIFHVSKRILGSFKSILHLVKKDISIIHSNNLTAAIYTIPALIYLKIIQKKIKFIWSNHDLTYPGRREGRILANLCHLFFDRTLAVSEAVKNKYPRFQKKISVLYNGLDIQKFKNSRVLGEKFRFENKIKEDEIIISIIGSISRYKGHLLLIEGYKKLAYQFGNTKLLIIGSFSPNEPELQSNIEKMIDQRLKSKIIFTGNISNIFPAYSGIDILVNATLAERGEPLGTTIYEAMAFEKIVLASDVGGTREIIENNIDGFLFKPDSFEDFYNKLKWIIKNWKNLESIRRNARKKVENKFPITKMVKKYNQILANI